MGNIRHSFNTSNQETTFSQMPYRLLYSSYSKYEQDWESYPHTHYFSELFYVLNGCGSFIVEEESFPIRKQNLIIINPSIRHTEVSDKNSPLEYIVLGVEGLNFLIYNDKEYLNIQCEDFSENLDFYFHTILREMDEQKESYETICQNLLEALIIQLSRHTGSPVEMLPSSKKITRECSYAKRFIDSNFRENITLDTLAELTHLNKYYFVHAFTKAYGLSPISYLNERRLQVSKELLETTDHSIAEVAQLSGFASQSYFSQSFRKSCHMTPGEYRRKVQQKNSAARP